MYSYNEVNVANNDIYVNGPRNRTIGAETWSHLNNQETATVSGNAYFAIEKKATFQIRLADSIYPITVNVNKPGIYSTIDLIATYQSQRLDKEASSLREAAVNANHVAWIASGGGGVTGTALAVAQSTNPIGWGIAGAQALIGASAWGFGTYCGGEADRISDISDKWKKGQKNREDGMPHSHNRKVQNMLNKYNEFRQGR